MADEQEQQAHTTTSLSQNANTSEDAKPDIVKKVCKVCSDNASGNHFGVMTCEACKSFFRRSIRANAKYYCNNHNACVIDKRNRNRCQACRLRKCLEVGMQPDSVQEERAPINRDIYSRIPPYTIPFQQIHMGNSSYRYFMYPGVQQPMNMNPDPSTFVPPHEVVKVEQPSVTPCKTEPPPPYTPTRSERSTNGVNGDIMPPRVPLPPPPSINYQSFSPPTTLHQQPPTTLHQQLPTTPHQQLPTTLHQQLPTTLHQQLPTTLHQQLPTTPHQQLPTTLHQQPPQQPQPQQQMLPSNSQHRRSAPTLSNGLSSYSSSHTMLQHTPSTTFNKIPDRPHSHSTPSGPDVNSLPPLSPTSALSDTSSVNSYPSHNVFQTPPTTMGPPRQIPPSAGMPLSTGSMNSDYAKTQSAPFSPYHQMSHDLSITQEFSSMPSNPDINSVLHYHQDYSPIPTGPIGSPTYPPLTMSNSQIPHDAFQPTVVRRHGSRSSSPTNSLISVGSGPSMGRPGSIRSFSMSGIDRNNGSVISGDTSHHARTNHDVESQGKYSFSHYRSRSPSSPTSCFSGSKPGSTRTASSYSGHSRALSHHSDPLRSRTSSISGPIVASIHSAHISAPPNPQHVYITLDQLMQSDKLLDGMQTNVHLMGGGPQEDVGDICNASLKKIVDWAKHMQMYVMISNSVLLKLIKNTWGELLCFMLAIRCSREPHMQLGGAQGSQLLNSTFYTQRVSGELKSWIIERQLTHHELACLKAVILFNPDSGLSSQDRQLVEILQVQTLNILKQQCRGRVPYDPTRYGQVMLKFGMIKQIGLEATSEIEIMQTLGAEIHDILDDLMNTE